MDLPGVTNGELASSHPSACVAVLGLGFVEPGKAKAWVVVALPMGARQGGVCRCLRSAHRRTVEWSICILQDPILGGLFLAYF